MMRVNCTAQNHETNSIEKSVWRLRELTDMVRCNKLSEKLANSCRLLNEMR